MKSLKKLVDIYVDNHSFCLCVGNIYTIIQRFGNSIYIFFTKLKFKIKVLLYLAAMHLNNNAFYLAAMHLTVKICIMQKLNPENMNFFFKKEK